MAGRRWIPRRCAETSAASVCTNAAAAADEPDNIFVGLAPRLPAHGRRPRPARAFGAAQATCWWWPRPSAAVGASNVATLSGKPARAGAASPIGFEAIRSHPGATSVIGIWGKPAARTGYAGIQAVITDIQAGMPDIRAAARPRCGALEANC